MQTCTQCAHNRQRLSSNPVQQMQTQVQQANAQATQAMPAQQPVQQVQQPSFREGRGRIKLPSLQHFSGDIASSEFRVVLSWLRQMQPTLKQEQSSALVGIAVMHLQLYGDAINWKSTVFLPELGSQVIMSLKESLKLALWTKYMHARIGRFKKPLYGCQAVCANIQ